VSERPSRHDVSGPGAYVAMSAQAGAGPPAAAPLRGGLAMSAAAAARVARGRKAQPNGWWGMALFLCAETTLFGGLIATYFYLDFGARQWPPSGIGSPSVTAPAILTAVLVATSVPMAVAARLAAAGARLACAASIALAMALQCGYISYQLHLFVDEVHRFPPQGSAYPSIYFTLLGLHHAHVILGIVLDIGVVGSLLLVGLSNYRLTGVRAVALYWHAVNAIAVAVLFTQISPSL
jgi:heme/copper-type cytochrome/quinol oxidase subunit 3